MYLIHKQGGYFNSISKMVEEVLGEPCKHTSNPNETGTWILFFTSFLSGFYKAIKGDYIVVQTEPLERTFNRYPEYKVMCENATKVLDYSKNFEIRYSNNYRVEYEESKEIDVLFYGVLSPRRKELLDKIDVPNKVILHTSPPVVGADLWKLINNSKIVLLINTHDSSQEFDWIRLTPLLSNKVFVIMEKNDDEKYDNLIKHIAMTSYDYIPTLIKHFLKNPLGRAQWADKGFDYIRQHKTKIIEND
jgi:hypothetical protein